MILDWEELILEKCFQKSKTIFNDENLDLINVRSLLIIIEYWQRDKICDGVEAR